MELIGEPTLLGVYGDPRRDSRRHTVSVTYIARTRGQPKAGDDVKGVVVVPFEKLPHINLAFDHRTILDDYLELRKRRGDEEQQQLLSDSSTPHHLQKKRKSAIGIGEEDAREERAGGIDAGNIQRDTCIFDRR